jgi:hypothetical protein
MAPVWDEPSSFLRAFMHMHAAITAKLTDFRTHKRTRSKDDLPTLSFGDSLLD